jgi:hypothetical protein
MPTTKQKQAARKNLVKDREAQRSRGEQSSARGPEGPMRAAKRGELSDAEFAFPAERKEPLTDPVHVRNAIARFDQVEGVTDAERDEAWRRIKTAARRHGVEIEADDWHDLFAAAKAKSAPEQPS